MLAAVTSTYKLSTENQYVQAKVLSHCHNCSIVAFNVDDNVIAVNHHIIDIIGNFSAAVLKVQFHTTDNIKLLNVTFQLVYLNVHVLYDIVHVIVIFQSISRGFLNRLDVLFAQIPLLYVNVHHVILKDIVPVWPAPEGVFVIVRPAAQFIVHAQLMVNVLVCPKTAPVVTNQLAYILPAKVLVCQATVELIANGQQYILYAQATFVEFPAGNVNVQEQLKSANNVIIAVLPVAQVTLLNVILVQFILVSPITFNVLLVVMTVPAVYVSDICIHTVQDSVSVHQDLLITIGQVALFQDQVATLLQEKTTVVVAAIEPQLVNEPVYTVFHQATLPQPVVVNKFEIFKSSQSVQVQAPSV